MQQKHIWQKALANPVAGIHLDMEIQAAGTILGVSPLGHVRHLHIHEASDALHTDAGHSSRIAPLGCSQFELLGAAQPMLPHAAQDHDAPSNSRPPCPNRVVVARSSLCAARGCSPLARGEMGRGEQAMGRGDAEREMRRGVG